MTFSRASAGRPVGTARRPPAFGPAIWLGSPDAGYDCLLALTRAALRGGRWDEAEALLMKAAPIAQDDAAFCDLAGILWEARGNVRLARKFYGRAIAADGHYGPAQQNMRRLFELDRFGRTRQPAALGDEPVAR